MAARTILHIDMDAFFASIEQRRNPALRSRPVAVIGRGHRTVITTASYHARRYGVRTGMNIYEARRLCPQIVFVKANNRIYTDTSRRILAILEGFSPKIEPFSIDEAFIDVTGSTSLFGTPRTIALSIKKRIREETGLGSSVGIGPNKLMAKLASSMQKPDGLVLIEEGEVRSVLERLPVERLCGIGRKLAGRLNAMGIRTCGQLADCPAGILKSSFGMTGERLKLMAQGIDPTPVASVEEQERTRSVGHSITLPRNTSDTKTLKAYLLRLSEKVCSRARKHGLAGTRLILTVRYSDFHTFTRSRPLPCPTNDTRAVYLHALRIMDSMELKKAVRLIGVAMDVLARHLCQESLFEEDRRRTDLLRAMDTVNESFGEFTLTWGTILESRGETGVISPSWRPTGARNIDET